MYIFSVTYSCQSYLPDYKLWLIKDSNIDYQFWFCQKLTRDNFQKLCEGEMSFLYILCQHITNKYIHHDTWFFYRTFRKRRSMIERVFGIIKNSYTASGTKFRSRRVNAPIICNLVASLFNRRKIMFHRMRQYTGHMYM